MAPVPLSRGEAVVQAIQRRDAEAPVDMIGLHSIGLSLDVKHFLIELHRIATLCVGFRISGIAALLGGAGVEAAVQPTIDLDAALLPPVAMLTAPNRGH